MSMSWLIVRARNTTRLLSASKRLVVLVTFPHNESRINEIRQILSVAKVVEGGSKRNVTVAIGTTVELADAKGKTTKYVIVGTTETNSLEHKISNESPAGEALIGHKKGDEVEFTTPNGKVKKYTITSITR